MTVFFSSDHHFNHENMIWIADRPFKDIDEMHEEMIKRHNSVVSKGDTVYVLGDFCYGDPKEYLKRMNGTIFLIRGNHDSYSKWDEKRKLGDMHRFKYAERNIRIILCHYPLREWDGFYRGYWHLFGHTHCNMPRYRASMDVGVDTNNFYPYSLEDITELFKDEEIPVYPLIDQIQGNIYPIDKK